MKILDELMHSLCDVQYGFPDKKGGNLLLSDPKKYDREFFDFYYLQTPSELVKNKCGVCWDFVEFERDFLEKRGIAVWTYFICTYDGGNLPSHTFLVVKEDQQFYYFEYSWNKYRGIYKYSSLKELLLDVKKNFIESHSSSPDAYTFVYLYSKPKSHLSCIEFYQHAEKGCLQKLNSPLYFYHLANKNAFLENGLYSLQYMYDHQLFDLFDKSVEKYKHRIVGEWKTKYYQRDVSSLTREEVIDALNSFRGEYGSRYIYFFRYPPKKSLGDRMSRILEDKVIYRINICDEEVQRCIKDIFYGYHEGELLDHNYYKKVTEKEYFSSYDDTIEMNFSKINHIAIAFQDDFCPLSFLEQEKEY